MIWQVCCKAQGSWRSLPVLQGAGTETNWQKNAFKRLLRWLLMGSIMMQSQVELLSG